MSTREALHEAIDELPDGVIETLARALERLRVDPVGFALDNAPIDDEPETEAEREAVAQARASLAAGRGIPDDEVGRILDALPH
jgi:hypothetical protein